MHCLSNDLEVDNPSSPDIVHVEDLRQSIFSMVPTDIGPNDGLWLHLLALFCGDLPGEGHDSRDD
jgi:hypothetical protein